MKAFVSCFASVALLIATARADWPTFGADPQRTGWARTETILNRETVRTLELKWKLQLDNAPKELTSLTAPVVADQVKTERGIKEYIFVGGSSDMVYAIDADTGKLVWQKKFTVTGTPARRPDTLCPYAQNATPVVDRGRPRTVYALSSDGKLHALSAVDGEDRFSPKQFVPAFSKNWSLNLFDKIIYTAIGQRCNGVMSGVYSADLSAVPPTGGDAEIPIHRFETGRPGIWGRAGVSISQFSGAVFAETGDGVYDPAAGQFADSFIALSGKELKLSDYYTPSNREWLTRKDLDMGNVTPLPFEFGGHEYLAGGGKEGRLYLLDTSSLGGDTHRAPLYRSELINNEDVAYAGHGFWGSFATWIDAASTRWLFVPAWGPPHPAATPFPVVNGEAPRGSIMAFRVEAKGQTPTLTPAWISHDLNVPEPPVIANGVVFALSSGEDVRQANRAGLGLGTADRVKGSTHAVLWAFDSDTGKELFSSGDTISSFTHFGGIAVSNGRIFVTTYDGMLYAFGIKNEER